MAEIVKISMIRDDRLFGMLEERGETLIGTRFAQPAEFAEDVITRSIDGMLVELSSNPYENMKLERFVDLGHMISPALEAQSGYKLHHGEAVAIDLAYTSCIANDAGLLSDADLQRIIGLIRHLGLPTNHACLDEGLVLRSFADTEKHRGGALNLPVPTGIGTCDFIRHRNELAEGTVSRTLVRLAETEDLFSDVDLCVVRRAVS
jgi:3-dehydroquinate synthetase